MDPNRRTTPLPKGMMVRILSPISRGGNIYGIDAEEVSKHTGIPLHSHALLSDWASVNDALFYMAAPGSFSLDEAAAQAAALGVPRVVLYRLHVPTVSTPHVEKKKRPKKQVRA